jgi:uroporphyrinogen decarboxylase
LLNVDEYREWAYTFNRGGPSEIEERNIQTETLPRGCANFFPELKIPGAFGIGIDQSNDMTAARTLSATPSLYRGTFHRYAPGISTIVADETTRLLDSSGISKGHIIDLGHGVLPETSVACVKAMVETVKGFR